MKRVLVMQARHGSTRLPGKVMLEVLPGRTMLDLTLERLRACRQIDVVVVAAPLGETNDAVAREASRCGAEVVRGDERDVLSRYELAADAHAADLVVRVCSDCPLSDPAVVDLHVQRLLARWDEVDFVTNVRKPSYPHGIAVEAMPRDVLRRMSRLSKLAEQREHVTSLAYDRPDLFVVDDVVDAVDRSRMRWTVDYPEDLALVRQVFQALYTPGKVFATADILAYLERHPEVLRMNAHLVR